MTLIEARDVTKKFGAFCAIDSISLSISEGEFVSIVGPNGAGKTTFVNLLTGLLRPTSGTVMFKNENIGGIGPVALSERGMARAFQLVQIFPQMTVSETLATAVVSRRRLSWRMFASVAGNADVQRRVREIAAAFGLEHRLETQARLLAQGEKKLLDVASAFALEPEVILLDEPTSGVSTAEKHGLMKTLVDAAKSAGIKAVILIEHDMDLVAAYSDRIVALSEGRVLADLPPGPFFSDAMLIETVIGRRRAH